MNLQNENVRLNAQLAELDRAYAELKENRDYYRMIADFSHDWQLWISSDFKLKYCSPSCLDLTGFTADEIEKSNDFISLLVYPADMSSLRQYLEEVVNFSTIRKSFRFRVLTRTKQIRGCEILVNSVFDSYGKYLGVRASVHDITNLNMALVQIHELSQGKEFEVKAKQKYKSDLESKDREMVLSLMLLAQKNELIGFLKKKLQYLKQQVLPAKYESIDEMIRVIQSSVVVSSDWDAFKLHFDKIHPGFLERLSLQFPLLTAKEKRLCTYLRMNLTSKEIAGLANITVESAEIARIRLRKKLSLVRNQQLHSFLQQI